LEVVHAAMPTDSVPTKICICIGLIAKRQAHGRSGLATSAMFFSAKKEPAKL
jgi:hypothetical protein